MDGHSLATDLEAYISLPLPLKRQYNLVYIDGLVIDVHPRISFII